MGQKPFSTYKKETPDKNASWPHPFSYSKIQQKNQLLTITQVELHPEVDLFARCQPVWVLKKHQEYIVLQALHYTLNLVSF